MLLETRPEIQFSVYRPPTEAEASAANCQSTSSDIHVILEMRNGAVVRLILPTGLPSVGELKGRCPQLAELPTHWASCVENGTWAVTVAGGVEDHDWFERRSDRAKLGLAESHRSTLATKLPSKANGVVGEGI
jgi:hypothetical protein